MVALMIWLLVVAAIGFLIVVGVLRPARPSGHKASTVFTRRQAAKKRKKLDTPVRSADERLSASAKSRSRGRHAAPAASRRAASAEPAAPAPQLVQPPSDAPAPAAQSPMPKVSPAPAVADTPAPAPHVPDMPVMPVTAAASGAQMPDDSVIDARTRWSRADIDTEGDSAEPADEAKAPVTEPLRPSGEQLRRAE